MNLSSKQIEIINSPSESLCVLACAGSGKTMTAVHRLNHIRTINKDSRSWFALLSFSNVAIDTFKEKYLDLVEGQILSSYQNRILIETFDSFLTSVILKPHASQVMGCENSPFLLSGNEGFLKNENYKFWYTSRSKNIPVPPQKIDNIFIDKSGGNFVFKYRDDKGNISIINNGIKITENLGAIGAYTHEFGRFWALKTLKMHPELLRTISKRYSHIIIDEAQDIGLLHKYCINLLIKEGSSISLIGDPSQAIYEFAGADGVFLRDFYTRSGVSNYELIMNYRSIPEINAVSSVISGKNISPKKTNFDQNLGAFFIAYDPKNPVLLKELFSNKISQCNISSDNAAILCRSNEMVNKLIIENSALGQGKIKLLTNAAIQRDLHRDYNTAFNLVTKCIVGLLINPPNDLYIKILQSNRFLEFYELKKDIWSFIRDTEKGLPLSSLSAKQDWVKILRTNLEELLSKCNQRYRFKIVPNINSVLSTRGLSNSPLYSLDVTSTKDEKLRVDTVHKSKGESIDAVLYIANGNHIEAMLNGINTETARIGYVALTRARNLFILGVPNNKINTIRSKLIDLGINEIEVKE